MKASIIPNTHYIVRSIIFLYLEILHPHYTGDVSTYLNIAKYD